MPNSVKIKPLEFNCKTATCTGKARYDYDPIPVSPKAFGPSWDPPEILGELTRVLLECDAADQHKHTYRVVYFKCTGDKCDEYVMGTTDASKDDSRIFKDDTAELECIRNHKKRYTLSK
jgi:hypothetical protein